MRNLFMVFALAVLFPQLVGAKETDFKQKLLGHWTCHEKNLRSGKNDREEIYVTPETIVLFTYINNEQPAEAATPRRYSLVVLNEKARKVKLTTYSSNREIEMEEALTFSKDWTSARHDYMNGNVIDKTIPTTTWKHVDNRQRP